MPVTDSAAEKRLKPLVLVDTADLTEEEWLSYRRRGIGGSDVAALLGISPWRTARDLYYDKLNVAAVEDEEGNWVALEMGHLLEPLVAKIFERKTGYKIYQITAHPAGGAIGSFGGIDEISVGIIFASVAVAHAHYHYEQDC